MGSPSKFILSMIIANEFCERFCYYGFRALLFLFLRTSYNISEINSTKIVHLFNFSCYFFTFIGGILSDALLGRYKTILYLTIIYLLGTIFTTYSSVILNLTILWLGLFLISIGTGGIKPCVSTFGGDQFNKSNTSSIRLFFNVFYFAINSGSLSSIFLSPIFANLHCLKQSSCYPLAFGIPSILLGASLLFFVSGRNLYRKEPPNLTFYKTLFKSFILLLKRKTKKEQNKNNNLISNIEDELGEEFVTNIKESIKIIKIFALIPFFWMLYDQQSTTWVEQATKMQTHISFYFFTFNILPSQMQAFNGVLILIFIPLFTKIIYPAINKSGRVFNNLNKMCFGMIFASLSFFISAIVEFYLNTNIHILWQIPQYVFLTAGEILLSMTGIEFVYAESPPDMKGLILSSWLMTVAIGNFYVIIYASMNIFGWLRLSNIGIWNYITYGIIGLIASFYFHRQALTFTFKTPQ